MAGDYWTFEEFVASAKMNALADGNCSGLAEAYYKTLQANDVFNNNNGSAADEFASAAGTNATVNTSSTDAIFSTDKYICKGGAGSYATSSVICDTNVLSLYDTESGCGLYIDKDAFVYTGTGDTVDDNDAHGEVFDSTQSTTAQKSWTILVLNDCVLKKVNKSSTCTATQAILQDENGNSLETVSFSGDIATFSKDLFLQSGRTYLIATDASGASYTRHYKSGNLTGIVPITGTNVEWVSGTDNQAQNVVSIDTQNATKGAQITNIKASLTDGSVTLSDIEFNDKGASGVQIVSTLGAGKLDITFTLSTTDTSITPVLRGYGVRLF